MDGRLLGNCGAFSEYLGIIGPQYVPCSLTPRPMLTSVQLVSFRLLFSYAARACSSYWHCSGSVSGGSGIPSQQELSWDAWDSRGCFGWVSAARPPSLLRTIDVRTPLQRSLHSSLLPMRRTLMSNATPRPSLATSSAFLAVSNSRFLRVVHAHLGHSQHRNLPGAISRLGSVFILQPHSQCVSSAASSVRSRG